jgi:hypothetical protein
MVPGMVLWSRPTMNTRFEGAAVFADNRRRIAQMLE